MEVDQIGMHIDSELPMVPQLVDLRLFFDSEVTQLAEAAGSVSEFRQTLEGALQPFEKCLGNFKVDLINQNGYPFSDYDDVLVIVVLNRNKVH